MQTIVDNLLMHWVNTEGMREIEDDLPYMFRDGKLDLIEVDDLLAM